MSTSPPLLETLVDNAAGAEVDLARLAALLDVAYSARRKQPAVLALLITDDPGITALNRRHLRRNRATDVLAFEDGDQENGRVRLGDVAISADTARRIAAERGVEFAHELAFYALHGLYHLLGMRDDSEEERGAMLQAQAEAMRKFGIEIENALLD